MNGSQPEGLILGEFRRNLDERFRVALPAEFARQMAADSEQCVLAKERPGCLSLTGGTAGPKRLEEGMDLVRRKLAAGRLEGRLSEVQLLGRLLSSRHAATRLDRQGRILLPEGFREFLGVDAGGEVYVVGAAVCIELWSPPAWLKYLQRRMPRFRKLLDRLAN